MATMEDEKLISLIRSFSCLYNKTHPEFKDSIERERVWTNIAIHMGATVDACQSRWRMLRERYAREKRTERLSTSEENASRSKWIYSDHLAFLEPHIHPRKRKWYVQCTPESSDEKQILYKMDQDELEAIEVVPVLMNEEEEEVSAASQSDRETFKPMPPSRKRPRPEVISVERRHEPALTPKRPADLSVTSTLLRILEQLSAPQEEDRDELFGKMIASELRGISDMHRKNRMKFQIQAVLFGEPEHQ